MVRSESSRFAVTAQHGSTIANVPKVQVHIVVQ